MDSYALSPLPQFAPTKAAVITLITGITRYFKELIQKLSVWQLTPHFLVPKRGNNYILFHFWTFDWTPKKTVPVTIILSFIT